MKQWELIFKSLANLNRLMIIRMLKDGKELDVGTIAEKLKISLKATSQHLIILKNVGVLENIGRDGHVYYFINPKLPADFEKAIRLFV